jgi:hypothetical protein
MSKLEPLKDKHRPAPSSATLKETAEGEIQIGAFTLKRMGLSVGDAPTQEQWQKVGVHLHRLEGTIQWLIGDWYRWGKQKWGDRLVDKLAIQTGYSINTIYVYASIAQSIPIALRKENLSYSHHSLIASLDEIYQQAWLSYADAQGLSVRELTKLLQISRRLENDYLADLQSAFESGMGYAELLALFSAHTPKPEQDSAWQKWDKKIGTLYADLIGDMDNFSAEERTALAQHFRKLADAIDADAKG